MTPQVRVCIECCKSLTDADRVSLAVCQEAKHSILWLHLDEERGRLLTLGHDRVSFNHYYHFGEEVTLQEKTRGMIYIWDSFSVLYVFRL
jgi:hypothetical protein